MKRLWWLTACCILAALAGCGGGTSDTTSAAAPRQFPLTFDNCGKKITIERPPERVLTIGTPAVDLLHQVGISDRVVARAGEYEVPASSPAGAAVQGKPIIDAEQPSLEKILGAGADMAIGYGPGKTTAEDLAGVEIPIYVLTAYCGPHGGGTGDGGQLTDVLADIEFLGQVFGTEQQATESAGGLQQRIDAAKAARPAGDRKTAAAIYFLGDARYTYSDQAIVSDQMATLGLTNALGSVDQDSALNVEAFIGAKPDVVVLIYGYEAGDTFEKAKQRLLAIPGVSAMKAVTSNRGDDRPRGRGQPDRRGRPRTNGPPAQRQPGLSRVRPPSAGPAGLRAWPDRAECGAGAGGDGLLRGPGPCRRQDHRAGVPGTGLADDPAAGRGGRRHPGDPGRAAAHQQADHDGEEASEG